MNSTHPIADEIVTFRQVDRRYVTLNRITGGIFALLVSIAMAVAVIFYLLARQADWIGWTVAAFAVATALGLLILAIVWPAWSYSRLRWRIGEVGLEIHRGVLWRHQISIPVARVQHADVSQGPLQRQFGLGTLIVHTAGTQNSSVELDGLAHGLAVELRDQIVKQKEATDVV